MRGRAARRPPDALLRELARAVRGLGAAVMMPQTLALIRAVFPAERRGAAFGGWSAVAGLATVAGPTVGGALVSGPDWRWIFFIDVPIGVAALVGALVVVPDVRTGQRTSLDIPLGHARITGRAVSCVFSAWRGLLLLG
ncbi:MFS transporter [Streptomyces coeruleorubidus]|uniref:MFS transporter n=1 Tax=Streptomyces coeruleorubidus TaxID=116188 RepID=UPI0036FFC08B